MKRIIAILLAMFFTVSLCAAEVSALHINNDIVIVEDPEVLKEINELQELKRTLEFEGIGTPAQIDAIDRRLRELGVEDLSVEELNALFCSNVSPQYSVVQTNDTKWTSTRITVQFRGKSYELQVIDGSPVGSANGRLRINNAEITKTLTGTSAAISAFELLGTQYLNYVAPVLGKGIEGCLTARDILANFVSDVSSVEVIQNIAMTTQIYVAAYERHVFVKSSGASDTGNQVLCYSGNEARYCVAVDIPDDTILEGEEYPDVTQEKYYDKVTSAYYNSYQNIAATNYWDYSVNGNSTFAYSYIVTKIKTSVYGTAKNYAVPYMGPSIA